MIAEHHPCQQGQSHYHKRNHGHENGLLTPEQSIKRDSGDDPYVRPGSNQVETFLHRPPFHWAYRSLVVAAPRVSSPIPHGRGSEGLSKPSEPRPSGSGTPDRKPEYFTSPDTERRLAGCRPVT